jgi:hypothetical protein
VGAEGARGASGIEVAIPAPGNRDAVDVPTGAPAAVLYVDPISGFDDNDGSSRAPFRTVNKAFSVAEPGATIWLRDGTYGIDGGESWSRKVPDGVSISAVTPGSAVLVGQFPFTALDFTDGGSVRGLVFKGFRHAVSGWAGAISIEDSAVETGGGFDFSGSVRATLTGVTMTELTTDGLTARGSADVVVTDGSLSGTRPSERCDGVPGIIAEQSGRVHLTGVTMGPFAGPAIDVRGAAELDATVCLISGAGRAECDGAQVAVSQSADVSIYDSTVRDGGGSGISMEGGARLALEGVFIGVHGITGVRSLGGTLTIAESDIRAGATGVFLSFDAPSDSCFIDGTLIKGNAVGVELEHVANAKIRGSTIDGGDFGVYAPSASPVFVDLGVALDPGENTIGGRRAALTLAGSYEYARVFGASGNTWNPCVQGADAEGKYPSQLVKGVLDGPNFSIAQSGVGVQL